MLVCMLELLSCKRSLILLIIPAIVHAQFISFVSFLCLLYSEHVRTKPIPFLLDQLQLFVQIGLYEFIHLLLLLFLLVNQLDKSLIQQHC